MLAGQPCHEVSVGADNLARALPPLGLVGAKPGDLRPDVFGRELRFRREPEQVFEEASALTDEGRHADARRVLHQLLARADALPEKDKDYRVKAQVRVADAWWDEAIRTGAFAPLPGLDHRSDNDGSAAKPGKRAGAKR